MNNVDENESVGVTPTPDMEKVFEYLCPMIERLSPAYIEREKINAGIAKHGLYLHFAALASIVASVFYLCLQDMIVGSAAVVVFGSIAGYIFGKNA